MRIVVASGNHHKVDELREMVAATVGDAEVLPMTALGDPPEIDETADTFEGNALLKARGIAAWLAGLGTSGDTLVLADDSGICVDVLDGAPSVRSARFAGEPSDDARNNQRLVDELRARGVDRSPAHYACELALVRVDGARLGDADVVRCSGRWDVEVRTEARGTGGFGYDPHAWLDGGARTVAELDREEKAGISHRGRAMARLLAWLRAWAEH